jgi:hypothetical protein
MWMRAIEGLLGLMFVGFTSVQFDDPDAALWVGTYGGAALLCFAAAAGYGWVWISAVFCVGTFLWSLRLLPQVRHVSVAELFGSFQMKTDAIEEAREGLGLLIVCACTGLLWLLQSRGWPPFR